MHSSSPLSPSPTTPFALSLFWLSRLAKFLQRKSKLCYERTVKAEESGSRAYIFSKP